MTIEPWIPQLIVAILMLLIVAYGTRAGRGDKERELFAKQREEDQANYDKKIAIERAETLAWRVEQMRIGDERHRDNKEILHGFTVNLQSIANSMQTTLVTMTEFGTWKLGHELRCNDRYDEMKESIDQFRITLKEMRVQIADVANRIR